MMMIKFYLLGKYEKFIINYNFIGSACNGSEPVDVSNLVERG